MKKLFFLFILAIIVSFACTEEDTAAGDRGNTNSNAILIKNNMIDMVSEDASLKVKDAAMRLEMPALRGGASNMFVVHTAPGYGINYAMEYSLPLKASRWSAYRTYKGFSCNENHWNRNYWKDGYWENDTKKTAYWDGQYWGDDPFQQDKLIPQQYRTTLADHQSNGHDRGHVIGSADRLNSMETNGQTFYLSNMHPQLAGFNQRGIWPGLENKIRNSWDKPNFRDTLYVVKGGVIDGDVNYAQGNGQRLIAPKYFFMALLCKNSNPSQGGYKAIGFWMKHEANDSKDFRGHAVSIDELERLTGLDFFCNLPDEIEASVESNMATKAWGI